MNSEMNGIPRTYSTAKGFFVTSAVWMIVGTFMGFLGAVELMAPDVTENIGWLVFGRIRPIHINVVLFGFVTPGLLGAAFYFLPRLLRTTLYSEAFGRVTVIAWNILLVGVVISLAMGHTQGREYAELIWPLDILVVVAFLMVFYNFIMTVKQRNEPLLYVSLPARCQLT